ncbi:putative class II aldolase/adducin domain protein [Metschnikowia bicuspidata var. bicuspidata NRRL YB-4993]|uniref:Putative class II aldolase/adducin domain protein n=1 Tax=Metschnikowia bicuspidata var. bicuspidata NRRL YB-4993 TaxID=869754 RepID=A0A1A0HCC4_9ASCO|nr:putative class II aldolase/adducin domain protein [Metschnikowia bicuspidata var. bicuspidata NRRL YB-4993]OBA21774.1 putative class II aldolase/adducin domain protein [Metschnikowia bicuspidata var. bicuspidata NRRL YB-4993]
MSPAPKITDKSDPKPQNLSERGSHNIARGMPHPYPLPKFDDKYEERKWAKQHMAGAFRVFARKGYTEGTAGHISLRDPVDPDTFWINPLAKHFGLIKASDLVHCDEAGNVLADGPQTAINAAGFAIHSAVHKARPDVISACHTHSTYGKAFSALGRPLDMISQDVCTFYRSHSVYTDFGGVAIDEEEGIAIASALGDGKGVILQNHGLLTVGATVDEAAYLFTLMEKSCECQLLADAALRPGEKMKLCGDEEAAYTEHMSGDPETLYTEFQPDFEMELYHNSDFLQ